MPQRYWLVHPHGTWQRIDPEQFDLDELAEQARRVGGRLVVEGAQRIAAAPGEPEAPAEPAKPVAFQPPVVALGHMFRHRLEKIFACKHTYQLEMNVRPTSRVLGGYYKTRRLVRIYTHDRQTGRRPMDELFDTFLHEIAHHLEYTEPESFNARACGRVPGRMHSRLFWRILGELKGRWSDFQQLGGAGGIAEARWQMTDGRAQRAMASGQWSEEDEGEGEEDGWEEDEDGWETDDEGQHPMAERG